ncbi:MAG TPA: S8 family peptidase [Lachnospiraceae bacterium]|nr:S8 family peptidase [Lachnospiraceae bacterium]
MTAEERFAITSEEYADFIINYRFNPQLLESFENAVIHILNEAYAVLHIPVPQNVNSLISEYNYSNIPKLFGLTSEISTEASGVERLRNIPNFSLTGNGVLIGIIDTGIDYRHPAFLKEDGKTKILSIWDQTIQSENGYPFETYFGTEYNASQINEAIGSANPLEVVPSMDTVGHGTMMAGVCAGTSNNAVDFDGVAPQAELVVVKLRQAKDYLRNFFLVPDNVECFQENDIMWGVQYCIQVARRENRPIAICLGVGSSQTAHTGQTNLCNFLSFVGDYANVGIAIGVGNEGNAGRHYFSTFDPEAESSLVELIVGENEGSFSMELWGESPAVYSIDITSPGGEYIPRITASLRLSREITFIFEQTVIFVDYQLTENLTGEQVILLRFRNPVPGVWRFNVFVRGDLPSAFHMWLPMGNFISVDTYFLRSNIYTTVLSPSVAVVPIGITAYNPRNGSLYIGASRGYSKDNTVKPELAAPGVDYLAPTLNNEYRNFTGTSVAASHTAGIIALFLEWAVVRENQIGIDTLVIKNYLIRGAKREENLVYPNRDWGYGIIDIFNTFDILRKEF